jgi:hypothetical protein
MVEKRVGEERRSMNVGRKEASGQRLSTRLIVAAETPVPAKVAMLLYAAQFRAVSGITAGLQ